MKLLKKILVMLLLGIFVFTVPVVASAQKEPREVVHDGYRVVINDEYLKSLPPDELTEMLDTILNESQLSKN